MRERWTTRREDARREAKPNGLRLTQNADSSRAPTPPKKVSPTARARVVSSCHRLVLVRGRLVSLDSRGVREEARVALGAPPAREKRARRFLGGRSPLAGALARPSLGRERLARRRRSARLRISAAHPSVGVRGGVRGPHVRSAAPSAATTGGAAREHLRVHPHLRLHRGHRAGVAVGVVSRAGSRASVGPAHALVLRRAEGLVTRLAYGRVPALDRSEGDLARASAPLARSRERVLAVLANVPRGAHPGSVGARPGRAKPPRPPCPRSPCPRSGREAPRPPRPPPRRRWRKSPASPGGSPAEAGAGLGSTAASTEALVSLRIRAARVHARLHLIVAHRAGTTRE